MVAHGGSILITGPPGVGKTTLLEQWAELGEGGLVVDDADLTDAGTLEDRLDGSVLDGARRAILAGRVPPRVALSRLRADRLLLEIGPDDLAFTVDEVREVLVSRGLEADDDLVTEVHARTEGWPIMVALAATALDGEGPAALSGRREPFATYCAEMIAGMLEPGQRPFIEETSILDALAPPVCDAVTGRTDSGSVLRALQRRGLVMTGAEGQEVRYRRILREWAEGELQLDSTRARLAHKRAATWFDISGDAPGAVRHSLAAGDLESAIATFAAGYLRDIERGDPTLVARTLDRFPRSAVTSDGRLAVIEAWAMSFAGRPHEAETALENARRSGYAGPLPDGASSVEASAALIRSGFPGGDVSGMLAAARVACEYEDRPASRWRSTSNIMLGIALYFAGDFAAAGPRLARGAALARADERHLEEVGALCTGAWVALETGQLDAAAALADGGAEIAGRMGLTATPFGGYPTATQGAVAAAEGRHTEAVKLLRRGIEEMQGGVEALIQAQCQWALATSLLVVGDGSHARIAAADAARLLTGFQDAGFLGERVARLVRLAADLSAREAEVLEALARGLSKREAARELFVTYNTIHTHLRVIYRKLGVSNRDEAVSRARALGLLATPD